MHASDPLQPHTHDNNVTPPGDDPSIIVTMPDGSQQQWTLAALAQLPQSQITYSFSTDHGVHGPYQLRGVALHHLTSGLLLREIEVISADGFGNRLFAAELDATDRPILLCTHSDGRPLHRVNGLVRLIVPSETDNALRQIKWVAHIRLIGA